MKNKIYKAAFLGFGNMGSAIIQGAVASGFLKASNITAFDVDKELLKRNCRKCSVAPAGSAREAVEKSEYVFLCVKPQQMIGLLREIKESVAPDKCLVSIAAGVKTASIEKNLKIPVPVVRVMPNTPALVRRGMSVLAQGAFAGKRHMLFVAGLFSSVGKTVVLPEKNFDAVTAVSGSGPAYLFYLAEGLKESALKMGIPAKAAGMLALETIMGAAVMLEGSVPPEELRRKVTSPGGTTEAAIKYLERKKWRRIFLEAVSKAEQRSRELSGIRI